MPTGYTKIIQKEYVSYVTYLDYQAFFVSFFFLFYDISQLLYLYRCSQKAVVRGKVTIFYTQIKTYVLINLFL